MSSATDRLEKEYQGRRRKHLSSDPNLADKELLDSATTDPNRESIQRVRYVFDQLLKFIPKEFQSDARYTFVKTMMMESLKDLALIPDESLLPGFENFANALMFVVNGSMEDLDESERDNPEEG